MSTAASDAARGHRQGVLAGVAAYGLWGVLPLYLHALQPARPWEVLAHRVIWTAVLCAAVLLVLRDLGWIGMVAGRWRLLAALVAASLLIGANWTLYTVAVLDGRTSDAALGYFLNPIVTVALGVLVLREALRPLQWIAVGIGLLAAGYLAVTGGAFPWTSILLALSFGGYGLVKKKIGNTLQAVQSLMAESVVLAPIAIIVLLVLGQRGELTFGTHGGWHATLLLLAGVVTAVPLVLFAAAARRVPLVTIGLLQFLTPIMQLLCAVLLLGEHMPTPRWIGFGIVWLALIVLTTDMLLTKWRARPRATDGRA